MPITKFKLETVPKQHTKERETSNYCIADNPKREKNESKDTPFSKTKSTSFITNC